MDNSIEAPQKSKNRATICPSNLPLGIYPKKIKQTQTLILKDTCTPMFKAALFIIAKIRKHPKCPSTEE